jgi:hypothetical protein
VSYDTVSSHECLSRAPCKVAYDSCWESDTVNISECSSQWEWLRTDQGGSCETGECVSWDRSVEPKLMRPAGSMLYYHIPAIADKDRVTLALSLGSHFILRHRVAKFNLSVLE